MARSVGAVRARPARTTCAPPSRSGKTHSSSVARGMRGSAGKVAGERRRAGRSGLVCNAGQVQKLNTEELEAVIQSRDKPVVIDFFATWCGPCVMLSKVLDQLSAEMGDEAQFVKVDTDEEVQLASYFQIQGLPTLVVLGKEKALRAEGLLPPEQIKQMIEEVSKEGDCSCCGGTEEAKS